MNRICQQILNSGFVKAERLHASYYKEIKVQLPRRQSERQNHPLNRHVKVLASIESRLSILRNTFNEYIEQGMCCFIPGKVCFILSSWVKYCLRTFCCIKLFLRSKSNFSKAILLMPQSHIPTLSYDVFP